MRWPRVDTEARAGAARVITGCGLAPGLSDVLARHAASALDTVDEVHVARFGVAGDACLAAARAAQRSQVLEWRDGAFVSERGHGAELIWFPDPVGARECELVSDGIEQLVAAVSGVRRASVRLGLPHTPRVKLPGPFGVLARGRQDPGIGWGAVRAEVWGTQGDTRTTVVYGVIERTGVAAGTVLGVTAAWLAGALPGLGEVPAPRSNRPGCGRGTGPVPRRARPARSEGGGVRGGTGRMSEAEDRQALAELVAAYAADVIVAGPRRLRRSTPTTVGSPSSTPGSSPWRSVATTAWCRGSRASRVTSTRSICSGSRPSTSTVIEPLVSVTASRTTSKSPTTVRAR